MRQLPGPLVGTFALDALNRRDVVASGSNDRISAGDFDGDGATDLLVVANDDFDSVSLMFGAP